MADVARKGCFARGGGRMHAAPHACASQASRAACLPLPAPRVLHAGTMPPIDEPKHNGAGRTGTMQGGPTQACMRMHPGRFHLPWAFYLHAQYP